MTDTQLYLAIGVPLMANAVLYALFFWFIKARFRAMERNLRAWTDEFHGASHQRR